MSESRIEEVLESERFLLEPIRVEHAAKLFEAMQPVDLYTYIPTSPPKSIDSLSSKFEQWEQRYSSDNNEIWLNYAIRHKISKEYYGTLQVTIIRNKETYVAYEVFPKFWRMGVAKECLLVLILFLFQSFGCEKVTAHLDTNNIASLKLLESLNFKKVGFLKDADFFDGHTSDEFIYELGNEDYMR
jgi:ribosomal-protein-alanine N-acetyltransferase